MQIVNRNSTKVSSAHSHAQKSAALRLVANAHSHLTLTAHDKAQIFAAVRAGATGRANAAQHQKLLVERARLIPDFNLFRSLVLEDLRAAYDEDRLNKTRSAKNRRLSWMALYKPFAALRKIDKALLIRAIDRSGHYRCELSDKVAPDQWQQFIKLGAAYGITEAELDALYRRAQARGKQLA